MPRWILRFTVLLCLLATPGLASGPVRLNENLPSGSNGVSAALISPDSQTVAMVGELISAGIDELFLTPIGGGAVTRIHQPFFAGGWVSSFPGGVDFSPNSSIVFYLADPSNSGTLELYAGPRDFSTWPVRLSTVISAPNGSVLSFVPLPDNDSAIYAVDAEVDGNVELYRGYHAGGGSGFLFRVSDDLAGDRAVAAYRVSRDGTRVVYLADQDTNDVYELYSAPSVGYMVPTGSWGGLKISATLTGGGQVANDFVITPDSNWVIYVADTDGNGVNEAWKVGIAGGSSSQIGPAVTSGSGVVAGSLQVAPDGTSVLFKSQFDGGAAKLVGVNTSTWGSFILTPSLPSWAAIDDFIISPDSQWVVLRGDADTAGLVELWATRMNGSTSPIKLSPPLSGSQSVKSYEIGANNRVTMLVDPVVYQDNHPYSSPTWGGGAKPLLPGYLASFNAYAGPGLAHDGRVAVFSGYANGGSNVDLWSGWTSGATSAIPISDPMPSGRMVASFSIAPDSSRVIYRADANSLAVFELYSTELPTAGFDSGPLLELLR